MTESTPRPTPHPLPKPGHNAQVSVGVSVPQPVIDDASAVEAATWGRVDTDGNVWLRGSGDEPERIVGQYAAGGTPDDALTMYVRRYLDLRSSIALLETRLSSISP